MALVDLREFEEMFVRKGRIECELYFRVSRVQIDAWLRKCGKTRLIKAREDYVDQKRAQGEWMTRSTKPISRREVRRPSIGSTIRDRRKVSGTVARHAAQHLRIMRNGGMIVSPAGDGEWWVGSKRLSAAQMLDLAVAKGFDAETPLHDDRGKEVKG